MDDAAVAVLGTGIMGAAMARNLLEAGMEVRVWNRSRGKAEPLAENGAKVTGDPAEAADGADFLITMLPDADIVEEVVGGEDGPLSVLAEDGVWLQTSTVGIEGNERLEKVADEQGVAYVDAPVLGTKQPAEQGQLMVLASGPEEVRQRLQQVFDEPADPSGCCGSVTHRALPELYQAVAARPAGRRCSTVLLSCRPRCGRC